MYTVIGFIAQPLGLLLSFLYGFIQNYGVTLLVFTLIVKLCLYPLYAKQVKSTVRMSEMQPKMKELQTKYAHDKQMLNMKMMEMYKKEKFNPMAGCLPMILQMPIIFALFMLLRNPTRFMPGDEMLMATHESFFWLMDLSQPDPWIMPVLAALTTFISFLQTSAQQGAAMEANAAMAPMMKMMKYFFPLMILVMGRSFPAGLIIYWFFGQAIQILFNVHLNKVRKRLREESEMRRQQL